MEDNNYCVALNDLIHGNYRTTIATGAQSVRQLSVSSADYIFKKKQLKQLYLPLHPPRTGCRTITKKALSLNVVVQSRLFVSPRGR